MSYRTDANLRQLRALFSSGRNKATLSKTKIYTRHTPLRDVINTNPVSHVVVTVCTPPCISLWKLNSLPLFYSWVSWGAWRGGGLSSGTCLAVAASGQNLGPCVLTKLSSCCWLLLFSCWRLHAFSSHISEQQRSIACIWSPLVPLKLSDCSQRRLWDWGRFKYNKFVQ